MVPARGHEAAGSTLRQAPSGAGAAQGPSGSWEGPTRQPSIGHCWQGQGLEPAPRLRAAQSCGSRRCQGPSRACCRMGELLVFGVCATGCRRALCPSIMADHVSGWLLQAASSTAQLAGTQQGLCFLPALWPGGTVTAKYQQCRLLLCWCTASSSGLALTASPVS